MTAAALTVVAIDDADKKLMRELAEAEREHQNTREMWFMYGERLSALRATVKSNKAFGALVHERGLDAYPCQDKSVRSNAMWIAKNRDAVLNAVQHKPHIHHPTHLRQAVRRPRARTQEAPMALAFFGLRPLKRAVAEKVTIDHLAKLTEGTPEHERAEELRRIVMAMVQV